MWQSRRDFQRAWEEWEAGCLAFHTFHALSFPWPAFLGRNRETQWAGLAVDGRFITPPPHTGREICGCETAEALRLSRRNIAVPLRQSDRRRSSGLLRQCLHCLLQVGALLSMGFDDRDLLD